MSMVLNVVVPEGVGLDSYPMLPDPTSAAFFFILFDCLWLHG